MTSIDVRFSEEDDGWVARSPEYPSLSWVDRSRSVAVLGLLNLLDEVEPSLRPAYRCYTDKPVARTYELGPSVMVDLDIDGEVVGVELLGHDVEFSGVPCPETLASIIRGLDDVEAGRTVPYHEIYADWGNENDEAGPIAWGGVTPLFEWWDDMDVIKGETIDVDRAEDLQELKDDPEAFFKRTHRDPPWGPERLKRDK